MQDDDFDSSAHLFIINKKKEERIKKQEPEQELTVITKQPKNKLRAKNEK